MTDFGIYILTYPGDYYLSTALVKSLKHFGPDIPIMIIPGEGVDLNDNPFDIPIMPTPSGFWGQIGHADRKFWSFQGPFEKFVYLDADIICTRPIAPFIAQLNDQIGKFISVENCIEDQDWTLAVSNRKHNLHEHCIQRVHSQLGKLELLNEFDQDYNPYARYPFNDGLFASSHLAITEEAFRDLYNREREFFKKRLKKEFNWKSFDLFFGDQGRLNYLVDRLGLRRSSLFPHGSYLWGGVAFDTKLEEVLAGQANYNYIHWAGCPRPNPSLFCKWPLLSLLTLAYPALPPEYKSLKQIPGYNIWWHFSREEQQKWHGIGERLIWTWKDAKLIIRRSIHRSPRFVKDSVRWVSKILGSGSLNLVKW